MTHEDLSALSTAVFASAFHALEETERRLIRLEAVESSDRPFDTASACGRSVKPLEEDAEFFSPEGNADFWFAVMEISQDGAEQVKELFLERSERCLYGLRKGLHGFNRATIRASLMRAETLAESRAETLVKMAEMHKQMTAGGAPRDKLYNLERQAAAKKLRLAETRERIREIKYEIEKFG